MPRLRALMVKEWEELAKIKMVLYGALFLPLFMGGLAGFMVWQGQGLPPEAQATLFNTALMYFLILPVMIPVTLAVYSIVGEKEQGTLEPLLATPLTDWEIFVGKALVAVLPSVGLTWGVFLLFLAAAHIMLGGIPAGVLSVPWLVSIFALSPLLAVFGVLVSMLVSSRTSDPRAAYQFSGLAVIPTLIPLIVYSVQMTAVNLLLVILEGGILIVLDGVLLYLAVKLFRREEILTRWK
ncbi:MAG: ABC transporter permease [Candidatus Bipolaricaulis anaerobius]|nr:ABC transporter permease [Candidatus Bipolaricaulis anaerobius]MDD5764023.1 ABC transporter permease [Candidatus Bipolaricaulis anaerobius]